MIDRARRHVATTADLTLVNLCWNIGRVITQAIQRNARRAGDGEQRLDPLTEALTQEYGKGYSRANLQDMRRFFDPLEICQTLSSKSTDGKNLQTASVESLFFLLQKFLQLRVMLQQNLGNLQVLLP
jgi:hypothetical protein